MNLLKKILISVLLLSAPFEAIASTDTADIFMEQKLQVYGIAGSPWEENVSYEEERARAYTDALNHAYEAILDLPLMDGKQIKHVLQGNKAFRRRLAVLLLSSPKKFYQTDENGINRCRLDIDLSGRLSLRSTFYLASLRPQFILPKSMTAPSASQEDSEQKDRKQSPYRRIIIDARKMYFEPSLFPRFFSKQGSLLFQEAMIPERSRFSRPTVLFASDIKSVREDLEERFIFTADSLIDSLHPRDVIINSQDEETFTAFCGDIISTPEKQREIVIVYDPTLEKPEGLMKKTEKEEKKEKQ